MNQTQLQKIAKDIIKDNIYLTLATADGRPWAAPLYYETDNKLNFYFVSREDSLHAKHIVKNPAVAFTIFDSHQPKGTGNGLQVLGKAKVLKGKELIKVLEWYKSSRLDVQNYKTSNYRLFKIVPIKLFLHGIEVKLI